MSSFSALHRRDKVSLSLELTVLVGLARSSGLPLPGLQVHTIMPGFPYDEPRFLCLHGFAY